MNILIHIEPYTYNDGVKTLDWMGMKFAEMLMLKHPSGLASRNDEHDVRILAPRLFKRLNSQKFSAISQSRIRLNQQENEFIESLIPGIVIEDSNPGSPVKVESFYEALFDRIRKKIFDFDTIVSWGEDSAVSCYAQTHDIKHVVMNHGCVRSPLYKSVYMDACGLDGDAITRQIIAESLPDADGISILNLLPFAYENGMEHDAVMRPIASEYADEIYSNLGRNVLIPLQYMGDNPLMRHSGYSSGLNFLKEVMPTLLEFGYKCFVMPSRPRFLTPMNKKDNDSCKRYCENMGHRDLVWLDDIAVMDIPSLYTKMDSVVSVNSAVGFEAMLFGTPAVCTGRSLYSFNAGLPSLDQLQNHEVQACHHSNMKKITNFLTRHYLFPIQHLFEYEKFITFIERALLAKEYANKQKFSRLIDLYCEINPLEEILAREGQGGDLSIKLAALKDNITYKGIAKKTGNVSRKPDLQKNIVVVLGSHRSGTSLITKGLEVLGVNLGDCHLPPKADNEKGFWEDVAIYRLNERMLKKLGCRWDQVGKIELSIGELSKLESEKAAAREIIIERLQSDQRPFGFKDPRTALLLPFWQNIFDELDLQDYYVIALRNPLDVAESMRLRNSISNRKAFILWAQHTFASIQHTHNCNGRVLVHYDKLVDDPVEVLGNVSRQIQLDAPDTASDPFVYYVNTYVSDQLRHSKSSDARLREYPHMPSSIAELYFYLKDFAINNQGDLSAVSGDTRWATLIERYLDYQPIRQYMEQVEKNNILLKASLKEEKKKALNSEALRTELNNVKGENSLLAKKLSVIEARNLELETALAKKVRRLNTIMGSLSWRVTAPFRWHKRQLLYARKLISNYRTHK